MIRQTPPTDSRNIAAYANPSAGSSSVLRHGIGRDCARANFELAPYVHHHYHAHDNAHERVRNIAPGSVKRCQLRIEKFCLASASHGLPLVACATRVAALSHQVYITTGESEFILCAFAARKNSAYVVWNKICAVWNGDAVYQAAAIFDADPAFRYHLQGLGINPVLDLEHPQGEHVFALGGPYRDRALRDDRSGIHFRRHKMHGSAVNFGMRLKRALVCIEALERGQQGRVNIQDAQVPFAHEIGGEQPHETSKADQIDPILFKQCLHRSLEVGAILAESGVIDDRGGNAGGLCNRKTAGIRAVGNYQDDFGGVLFIFCGFNQCRHVRSAAGNENRYALSTHISPEIELSVVNDAVMVGFFDDAAKPHSRFAGAREDPCSRVSMLSRDDDDHSNPAIESSQHLIFGYSTFARQPLEYGQHGHARKINARAEPFWQHARNVVGKSTPGDMRQTFHRLGFVDRCETRFYINARRGENCIAEALLGHEWRRGLP